MENEKWSSEAEKKIRFMANHIWNGISYSDIERFLNNFPDNKSIGLALLDMLIYYSVEQESSIVENLLRLLARDLWQKSPPEILNGSSNTINEELDKTYQNLCLIPVKDDHDPSSSAFALTSSYKKAFNLPKCVKFIEPTDVPLMLAMKKTCLVFYDDIIGTGNQFREFWSITKHFTGFNYTLQDISKKNPDVKIYYLVLGACKESIIQLERDFPNITIIASEIFSTDYSVMSEENEYWEFNKDLMKPVQDYVKVKEAELRIKNEFSKYLSVLFQHTRAQNTALSLYWYEKENAWSALYRR